MYSVVIAVCVLGMIGGCSALNKYFNVKDDHPLEELSEQLIKDYTSVEIDLTPESDER